jgi:hypothetical protein
VTDSSGFDDLPEEKVKFSEAEIAATLAKLDDAIARMVALCTEVEDPDGLIRFTLGDDGRLLTLFIQDNVAQLLTNIDLEDKLNRLLDTGNQAMRLSRNEFWGRWTTSRPRGSEASAGPARSVASIPIAPVLLRGNEI